MPSVLDMPIEGQVVIGHNKPNQKPLEELAPLINDVLDDPSIEAIRWRQYTPYFNDGEACIFGVADVYFRLAGGDPQDGDYEDGFLSIHCNYFKQQIGTINGQYKYDYNTGQGHYEYTIVDGSPNPELAEACVTMLSAINSGAYDDALYKAYGDHAVITVDPTVDKVIIYFLDHE
jgi:hypothetical protein